MASRNATGSGSAAGGPADAESEGPPICTETVREALRLVGVELDADFDVGSLVDAAKANLKRYEAVRAIDIPNDVSPPYHFSPITPGMVIDTDKRPFTLAAQAAPICRPDGNLEAVAFWPVTHLCELIRTRQVTSLELTEMYLERLHRYNPLLNCVVTFLDHDALAEARQADADIAAGNYRGGVHGIPWGAKDIISLAGHRTTWGSKPFEQQEFDYDATVVERLRNAGAVCIAKLTTGELAGGDHWFGGQTMNPWNPHTEGSSGSSAGSASATAAGCVGFSIGTETSGDMQAAVDPLMSENLGGCRIKTFYADAGSILSPSARCGLAGLRPTLGRISRYGVMALSWTLDRLGPMCRYAEDCALVMAVVAGPDGKDISCPDIPFNWNGNRPASTLQIGWIKESFDDLKSQAAKQNAQQFLQTLRTIGICSLLPVKVPGTREHGVASFSVESGAFFEKYAREGKMSTKQGKRRMGARLVPAIEFLQSQRLRTMMMTDLAAATAHVDCYLVFSEPSRGTYATPPKPGADAGPRRPRDSSAAQRHSSMANSASYPAVNIPNGFNEEGSPTHVTVFARPYGEEACLLLAKAYQDAACLHTLVPPKLEDKPKSKEDRDALIAAVRTRQQDRERKYKSTPAAKL